jgi:hypothetical protein
MLYLPCSGGTPISAPTYSCAELSCCSYKFPAKFLLGKPAENRFVILKIKSSHIYEIPKITSSS